MAQYATVNWQPGDEVTSQKLQQMAQNEQWLKDNIIIGNMNFFANEQGTVAFGRQAGIVPATKIEAINYHFDSQVPVSRLDVTIPYPPVFTQPPIAVATLAQRDTSLVCKWYDDNATDKGILRIFDVQKTTITMAGSVNVILFGV